MARLAGRQPGQVHVLVKLHNWSGRAIYLYNLTVPETSPPEDRMRHVLNPSPEIWEQYCKVGVEIPHPGKMQAKDVNGWVSYAKREAKRLGLKVE